MGLRRAPCWEAGGEHGAALGEVGAGGRGVLAKRLPAWGLRLRLTPGELRQSLPDDQAPFRRPRGSRLVTEPAAYSGAHARLHCSQPRPFLSTPPGVGRAGR